MTVIDASALRFEQKYLPVSHVAKDWNVTPRRIRSLLAAKRLTGRQGANGYWEVAPLPLSIHRRHARAVFKTPHEAEARAAKAGRMGGIVTKKHFTGGWKIMNMQKLGTLGQSEKGFRNRLNPMNTGLRAIHYAKIRNEQNGKFAA